MNRRNILKIIGVMAISIAIFGSAVAFTQMQPAAAHGPDVNTPPVMAGELHPDTPVHPVVPEQVVAPVQSSVAQRLEDDMRGVFLAAGYDSMFVECLHSAGSVAASADAHLLSSSYSLYNGMPNPPSVWMDDVHMELASTAEVAVCAGSASRHAVSGVPFN